MNKNIYVAITGMQVEYADMEEREDEAIEVISPATYFFKDGLHYVFYEEMEEGSTGVIQNKIVLKEDEFLEVTKKGMTNSSLKFDVKAEHNTNYETPYGEMLLGVTTHKLVTTVGEDNIAIQADYELAVNCEAYASCQIKMRIYEKELGM